MGQRISLMLTQAAKATGLSEAAILARHRGGADRRHEGYAGCLARRPYRALPRCNGKHSYKCQEDAEQTREALLAINEDARRELWAMIDGPAPGSEDTELGVLMELEVGHGETEVYAGVQA